MKRIFSQFRKHNVGQHLLILSDTVVLWTATMARSIFPLKMEKCPVHVIIEKENRDRAVSINFFYETQVRSLIPPCQKLIHSLLFSRLDWCGYLFNASWWSEVWSRFWSWILNNMCYVWKQWLWREHSAPYLIFVIFFTQPHIWGQKI